PPPPNHTGPERRAAPRYRCLRECLVRQEGGASEVVPFNGMVFNVSLAGVGLALHYPAPVGAVLTVELLGRGGAPPARARVVRRKQEAFVWFHGCEFLAPLGEAELRAWLR
ncbi:MAG TPA: PilZ domain-containing protein, partial [Gemmataceae bacterium]|nr:PilZ domain-containing protein [Gemmataceae bacterium]